MIDSCNGENQYKKTVSLEGVSVVSQRLPVPEI